jgi:hypothetical protein
MDSTKLRSITFPKRLPGMGRFIKAKTRPNKTKQVRFATSKQCIPSITGDCEAPLWYQPADYTEFRSQSTADAENVKSRMSALANCISYAYETAERIASNALDEICAKESLDKLDPDFQLLLWCNAVWSRGNEKSVLNSIGDDQLAKARLNHRTSILQSQRKCDDETIRFQSENLTRTNRVFARMIGVADAQVALRLANRRPRKTLLVEVDVDNQVQLLPIPTSPCSELPQPRQVCAQQA